MKSSAQVKGCTTGILIQIVETGELFDTRTKCAEKLGVTVGAVSMCLNGKIHTCGGYHLRAIKRYRNIRLTDNLISQLNDLVGKSVEWRKYLKARNVYVSSEGNVAKWRLGKLYLLNQYEMNSGYLCVSIFDKTETKKHRRSTELVHRIVAETFLENDDPINKKEVNHLDGNKHNNAIDNLEWCTKSQNMKHAVSNGLAKTERVMVLETGILYPSSVECAKAINGTVSGIHDCKTGRQKQHRGYHFYFPPSEDELMQKIINSFPDYELRKVKKIDSQGNPYFVYENWYRGVNVGRGGYVVGNPGMYTDVVLLDVQSMHPHSIIALNYFGEYTQKYKDLLDLRLLIKHGKLDEAKKMFDGKLAPYLDDPATAKQLSNAAKIALNACYGLTAANFDNPMRHPKNVNNIVALRGALFMKTLQDKIEAKGFDIVAIRTDSIKIVSPTKEIIDFCMEFAKSYGYTFEFECVYSKICQIDKTNYIARYATADYCQEKYGYVPDENKELGGEWTETGATFQVPYIFKTLFTHKPIVFDDLCETKEVKKSGAIYLDMNERLPEGEHNYIFVGKVGQFTPVKNGANGGELVVKTDTGKYNSVQGASGYRWMESEVIRKLYSDPFDIVDMDYYTKLADEAVDAINKYGDFEWFVSDDPGIAPWDSPGPPWDEGPTAFDVR